ncbi:MAG: DinB family protein [Nocardioidaceae bacterium]|nr:DinB family protein [Nocardioidaceae bacterium]
MAEHRAGSFLDPADDPRHQGATPGGEKEILTEYLRHHRQTLELKCAGLDAEQLARRAVPPSTMSLLGLVRHLAEVERAWFRRVLSERPDTTRIYRTPDEPDLDWDGAVADSALVEEAWANLRGEQDFGTAYLAAADLDSRVPFEDGTISAREVIVHLIEEYARHNGHADLLRECLDGRVGE